MTRRRILILGGTTESRQMALNLAKRSELEVTVSLAGRTASALAHPVPVRRGGFGGASGLAQYLRENRINALIDATHPYAAIISANARQAAADTGTPLLALVRPAWQPLSGDDWTEVADASDAVRALGAKPQRVFLAMGRQEIAAFALEPQHYYLVRSVEPVEPPLPVPNARYILARGPFAEADDRALLESNAIDTIVAKNSGGSATYSKIAAARALGVRVLMLRRPAIPTGPTVATVAEAVSWLDHLPTLDTARGV
jgi:precorrin-6A/cobalt-precorrin-6A reductase